MPADPLLRRLQRAQTNSCKLLSSRNHSNQVNVIRLNRRSRCFAPSVYRPKTSGLLPVPRTNYDRQEDRLRFDLRNVQSQEHHIVDRTSEQ